MSEDSAVFATCRNPEDAKKFRSLSETPGKKGAFFITELNVIDKASVFVAQREIQRILGPHGLDYPINNASMVRIPSVTQSDKLAHVVLYRHPERTLRMPCAPWRQTLVNQRSSRGCSSLLIKQKQSQPVRTGVTALFSDLAALGEGFGKIVALLPLFDPETCQRYGSMEPINVLDLALRIFDKADNISEEGWAEHVLELVNERNSTLVKRGVRRITIVMCKHGQYLLDFTLRGSDGNWVEEQAIRNIESALAFQLELGGLSNYKLTRSFG